MTDTPKALLRNLFAGCQRDILFYEGTRNKEDQFSRGALSALRGILHDVSLALDALGEPEGDSPSARRQGGGVIETCPDCSRPSGWEAIEAGALHDEDGCDCLDCCAHCWGDLLQCMDWAENHKEAP